MLVTALARHFLKSGKDWGGGGGGTYVFKDF